MTLNLLVAAPDQIHMSCDFRLTDRDTGELIDDKTQKLTSFSAADWSALVAVTGVGALDDQNVGHWVASKLGSLPFDSRLDDLLEVLTTAETSLSAVRAEYRHHTFTVGAITHGRSFVALVSNFQSLHREIDLKVPESTLTISKQRPTRVRVYATGSGASAVQEEDLVDIEGLVKAGASQQQIQEKLKSINENAAGRLVSRGCYVASRLADRSGTARPFLTDEQKGDFIPPESSEMFRKAGIQLNPALDDQGNPLPLRMDRATYAVLEMTAGYFKRELSKRPDNAELQNNYGVYLNRGRQNSKAEAAFRRSLELDPNFIPARRNLAGLLSSQDATRPEALQIYEGLVAENEATTEIRSEFAMALEMAGDLDRAEQEHSEASRAGDWPRAIARHAAFEWHRRSRVAEAEAIFSRIQLDSTRDAEPLQMMARFRWFAKNDIDAAEDLFSRALSLDPKNVGGLCGYGDLLLYKGDAATALPLYRRANKLLRGKNFRLESNEGFAILGVGSRPERAIVRFQRVIKINPDFYAARVNLGLALHLSGQHHRANSELATLRSRGDVPTDVVLELNILDALFGDSQELRNSSKAAVDELMQKEKPAALFLNILKRHFRSRREVALIEDWAT